jgi:hypothetical protein
MNNFSHGPLQPGKPCSHLHLACDALLCTSEVFSSHYRVTESINEREDQFLNPPVTLSKRERHKYSHVSTMGSCRLRSVIAGIRSSRKAAKMARGDLLFRDSPADLLHLGNVLDGIHLLHELRLDLRKSEGVESFA